MKHIIRSILVSLSIIFCYSVYSQDIPVRPNPPRLVNDLAGLFSPAEVSELENILVAFSDSTTNQIVVLTVNSLNGLDANQFAYQVGEKWGVGQKGKNNGIVILVKPKVKNERGAVSIQVGYGLEAVVPDAIANQIEDQQMIPFFKQNDYYNGVKSGVLSLIALTRGEYKAEKSTRNGDKKNSPFSILIIIILLIIFFFSGRNRSNRHHHIGRSGIPWWLATGMGASSGRGSFGNFSGGRGGFGGFGGGSFGGGGASGSW